MKKVVGKTTKTAKATGTKKVATFKGKSTKAVKTLSRTTTKVKVAAKTKVTKAPKKLAKVKKTFSTTASI